jgi:hypothetical protein
MARPRKWADDRERRIAQSDRRRSERQAHDVEFIGVDGEGTGRWRDHTYVLLGCGEQAISSSTGLDFTSIMDFLYTQYLNHPNASFAGFFLGYDFTQWLKGLPENRARMLLTPEGRAKRVRRTAQHLGPFPVTYDGWEFDILGMKRFKLRPEGVKGQWMYICDAGPFFQASLMSVIDPRKWDVPIVTEDEYAILEEGKRSRDSAVLGDGMQAYNALENAVLARLMGRVNDGLAAAGIRLRKNQWFGPGQAAQAWLNGIKAPAGDVVREALIGHGTVRAVPEGGLLQSAGHMQHVNSGEPIRESSDVSREPVRVQSPMGKNIQERHVREVIPLLDAARMSYYGGWFEIFAHGHIPGDTWEYDINSAYPSVISALPCLLHGVWRHTPGDYQGASGSGVVVLSHARVRGGNRRIGAMLHRREDHGILRPLETAGWYWRHELDAASAAGLIDSVVCDESWAYQPCGCPPPMRGIAGLYDERLRVGKNTPHGRGLKLVYNSVYGKFAQSVGDPKYGNAVYASLVTAGCRTQILQAIGTHPEGAKSVVMVATDGVYFREPHNGLGISDRLGEWSESVHSNLTLFKPGVYWDDHTRESVRDGDSPAFKARGISARAFAGQLAGIDRHYDRWPDAFPGERDPEGPRDGWYPKVTFQSGFSMVTAVQALARRRWHLAGAVSDVELTQDADPIGKRHSGYYEDGVYWSRPFANGGSRVESFAYDRRFGQPDPDEYGITDDGTVKDQWARMFR